VAIDRALVRKQAEAFALGVFGSGAHVVEVGTTEHTIFDIDMKPAGEAWDVYATVSGGRRAHGTLLHDAHGWFCFKVHD
jgi:hypothetical protein